MEDIGAETSWARMRVAAVARGALPAWMLVAATVVALVVIRFEPTPLLRGPAPFPPEWQWGADAKPWSARRAVSSSRTAR